MRSETAKYVDSPRDATGSRVVFICLSLVCISCAMPLEGGRFSTAAITWMVFALLANIIAMVGIRLPGIDGFARRQAKSVCGLCAAVQLALMAYYPPGAYLRQKDLAHRWSFYPWLVVLAVAVLSRFTCRSWPGRLQRPLLLVGFACCAVWVFIHSPNPPIDTFVIHQEASAALLKGRNPYAEQMTNIYGVGTPYLPDAYVTETKLLFGYTYPPLSLLAAVPGYAAYGDHRLSMLLALLAGAGLLAWLRPGDMPLLAAGLLLTFSRVFEMLESSWTEPVVVLLLVATLYSAHRASRLTPWLFGLMLISKQHMVLFAPAGLLLFASPLRWREVLKFYAKAMAIALVVLVPFAAWDFDAFVRSVVKVHFALTPRVDSLSLSTLIGASQWRGIALAASLAGLVSVYVFAWLRGARGVFVFAMTISSAAFLFFMLGKGFMNYYYLVTASMCCALAVLDVNPGTQSDMRDSSTTLPSLVS